MAAILQGGHTGYCSWVYDIVLAGLRAATAAATDNGLCVYGVTVFTGNERRRVGCGQMMGNERGNEKRMNDERMPL